MQKHKLSIFSKNLHIEGKFQLCVRIWIVDLEQSMDEFFEIYVSAWVQIQYREPALTDYTRQLAVLYT